MTERPEMTWKQWYSEIRYWGRALRTHWRPVLKSTETAACLSALTMYIATLVDDWSRWVWVAVTGVNAFAALSKALATLGSAEAAERRTEREQAAIDVVERSNARWPGGADDYLAKIERDQGHIQKDLS